MLVAMDSWVVFCEFRVDRRRDLFTAERVSSCLDKIFKFFLRIREVNSEIESESNLLLEV